MATIALRAIEVAKTVTGNSPWTMDYQEAVSQTFLKGAFLATDANNRLVEAGADPTRIVGIAAEAGHNYSATGTDKTCKVWVADMNTIFVANVSGSSITTLFDIGGRFGIVKSTYWHVDKTDGRVVSGTAANARVLIVDLDSRDNVGDTNARVHFLILSDFNVLTGTS